MLILILTSGKCKEKKIQCDCNSTKLEFRQRDLSIEEQGKYNEYIGSAIDLQAWDLYIQNTDPTLEILELYFSGAKVLPGNFEDVFSPKGKLSIVFKEFAGAEAKNNIFPALTKYGSSFVYDATRRISLTARVGVEDKLMPCRINSTVIQQKKMYDLVVSFISIGGGIDTQAYDEFVKG